MQEEDVGLLPRLLGGVALAYALSPIDLIPDFIPVLGLLDDLLLLPGLIWLALRLVPPDVLERARARAQEEPLRLSKNWGMAALVLAIWDALFIWLIRCALQQWQPHAAWSGRALGASLVVLVGLELVWAVKELRDERRREQQRLLSMSASA
uniref:DUF1232 domain-containing protein n=1 Tax=Alexandrium andersonii TaxID=327968 RepID=A0A7S2DMP9_9DINO